MNPTAPAPSVSGGPSGPPGMPAVRIGLLDASHAAAYKALRDAALLAAPEAFTSDYASAVARPAESYAASFGTPGSGLFFLGAFDADSGELLGSVGCERQERLQQRHCAHVIAMMVATHAQRRGIGRQLLRACIDYAPADGRARTAGTVGDRRQRERRGALRERGLPPLGPAAGRHPGGRHPLRQASHVPHAAPSHMSPMTFRPGHPPPPSTPPATAPAATVAHDLPVDAVHERLAALAEPVRGIEQVGIFAALDRILAEDVVSPMDVPPHDNSAMDGFAFDGAALVDGQPLTLQVAGTVLAGHRWQGCLGPGQCLRIMTGAVMPHGADTVIPQEAALTASPAGGMEHITIPRARSAGATTAGARARTLHAAGPPSPGEPGSRRPRSGCWRASGRPRCPSSAACGWRSSPRGTRSSAWGTPWREGAVYDSNRYTPVRAAGTHGRGAHRPGRRPGRAAGPGIHAARGGGACRRHRHQRRRQHGCRRPHAHAARPPRPGGVLAHRHAAGPPDGRGPHPAPGGAASSEAGADGAAVLFALPGNPVAAMVAFSSSCGRRCGG